MQMNFDSASFGTRTAALPGLPNGIASSRRPLQDGLTVAPGRRVSPPGSKSVRFTAWEEGQRGETMENLVWVAVGLCAAVTLALSIFA
jgi:hypothetical protein